MKHATVIEFFFLFLNPRIVAAKARRPAMSSWWSQETERVCSPGRRCVMLQTREREMTSDISYQQSSDGSPPKKKLKKQWSGHGNAGHWPVAGRPASIYRISVSMFKMWHRHYTATGLFAMHIHFYSRSLCLPALRERGEPATFHLLSLSLLHDNRFSFVSRLLIWRVDEKCVVVLDIMMVFQKPVTKHLFSLYLSSSSLLSSSHYVITCCWGRAKCDDGERRE